LGDVNGNHTRSYCKWQIRFSESLGIFRTSGTQQI